MKNRRTMMKVFIPLLLCVVVWLTNAWAGGKIMQDSAVSELSQRLATLQNRYNVVKFQWYDIYADGLVPGADDGGKLIIDAKAALSAGNAQQATKLLDSAEQLLGKYEKGNLPLYTPPEPMKTPTDKGNIHLATIKDLKMMEFAGVPRWNYWYNFVGKGSDGEQYMLYVCINHHGTGKIVLPVLFAISSTKNPADVRKLNFTTTPVYSEGKDSITYTVKEGDRSLIYTLAQGRVKITYRDAEMSVVTSAKFDYSFWYNKGIGGAEMMPNAVMAGFEQMGAATAQITFKNKKVTCKGFAEQENLFCGGPKSADYRTALLKFGNEWWVPFYTDQASGLFCMTGRYRDAGIYYKGKYYTPSEFTVTPLNGNTSFIIDAKFAGNNLHLIVDLWGWDPKLYEHWGNAAGSVNGTKLTNGFAWLEHIPQGGVNNSPPTTGKAK
jgi:hypothetical protein